ncbi:unnamed protein product [Staurois parvus]|uniref:Uncharacterized protein n=1 Tax=Staurois parvus TaxID=386267 RepID=A0ABN9EMJ9_9NEOB|nr:unnamed protein product [Staurois parvus]
MTQQLTGTADNWQLSENRSALIIWALRNSAQQCHPPVPSSAAHQCPSLLHISTPSLVPPHQCCLSVLPVSAASSTHISEGEKLPVSKIL